MKKMNILLSGLVYDIDVVIDVYKKLFHQYECVFYLSTWVEEIPKIKDITVFRNIITYSVPNIDNFCVNLRGYKGCDVWNDKPREPRYGYYVNFVNVSRSIKFLDFDDDDLICKTRTDISIQSSNVITDEDKINTFFCYWCDQHLQPETYLNDHILWGKYKHIKAAYDYSYDEINEFLNNSINPENCMRKMVKMPIHYNDAEVYGIYRNGKFQSKKHRESW